MLEPGKPLAPPIFGRSVNQTMTEAEHNRPIPKLFSNRPSASAAEVFGLLREPIIFFENNMWNFIESEFHT